jgi:tripartite-type tricarboxylate transporter receptor subunit TctC
MTASPIRRALAALIGLPLVVVALFSPTPIQAQDYPTKPIRFVVASQAGGVTDLRARRLGQRLGELLKQPIVVENRPGASGTIAAEFVAKSTPDGYTALFGGNNELVVVPALGTPVRYDPMADFVPVAQFSKGYSVFVVHPSLGVKTVPELIEWATVNPGKLLCGTAGHGSGQHFTCELLARVAKIQVRSVPYKGTGPMLLDAAGGQVHIAIGFLAEVDKQYIQTGKLIPMAAMSPKRLARFPQLPTMSELGFDGFDTVAWTGIFMPTGAPSESINRINGLVAKIVQEPDFSSWLTETGSEVVTPSADEFRAFTSGQFEKWKRMSAEFGIRAEP